MALNLMAAYTATHEVNVIISNMILKILKLRKMLSNCWKMLLNGNGKNVCWVQVL